MSCALFRDLLDTFLAGTIADADEQRLLDHTRECAACREDYESIKLAQSVLQERLGPRTPAVIAAARIEAAIANLPAIAPRNSAVSGWWTLRRSLAIAASIALIIGFFGGYGLSRWGRGLTAFDPVHAGVSDRPVVAVNVTELDGIILHKRSGATAWHEMSSASAVRMDDVIQASPESELRLAFEDGSTLILSANSRLAFAGDPDGLELNLTAGAMRVSLNAPHPPFVITTPSGRVEAASTEFTVLVEPEGLPALARR